MLVAENDWRERARELANTIAADGVLRDPVWRTALEATPRHVFVPRFYTQRPGGEPVETTSADVGWLDAVYRNEALITSLGITANGKRFPVSSSSKPGLMIRMLEALDVADAQRVLEIGTGTGYNAALLTRELGDDRVFSVDIGAGLVTEARERLASLQLAPTLVVGDGAAGLPGHAPYDRIIATCSVPEVPPANPRPVRARSRSIPASVPRRSLTPCRGTALCRGSSRTPGYHPARRLGIAALGATGRNGRPSPAATARGPRCD